MTISVAASWPDPTRPTDSGDLTDTPCVRVAIEDPVSSVSAFVYLNPLQARILASQLFTVCEMLPGSIAGSLVVVRPPCSGAYDPPTRPPYDPAQPIA